MPSRMMHDILRHLLETSDVHMPEPNPVQIGTTSGFQQMYMGAFNPQIVIRRTVRHAEIQDFPVQVYQEFIELLESWGRNGHPIDISRRFQGVRLIRVESMPNPESFNYDFRLEFTCDSIDSDHWGIDSAQREQAELRRMEMEARMQEMMQQPRRSAMLPSDWFDEPKKAEKKLEKHFEDDLFEV